MANTRMDRGETVTPAASRSADDRSVGSLMKELTDETRRLFRQEVELARAETTEKVARMTEGARTAAIGSAIALAGLFILMTAINRGVTSLFSQVMSVEVAIWLAPLVLAAVLVVIGYSMIKGGTSKIRQTSLAPHKTAQSLKEDKEWLKDRM